MIQFGTNAFEAKWQPVYPALKRINANDDGDDDNNDETTMTMTMTTMIDYSR